MSKRRESYFVPDPRGGFIKFTVRASRPVSLEVRIALEAVAIAAAHKMRLEVDIEPPAHDGDLAEYSGPYKRLKGKRCEVLDRTPTGKRVRAIFRLGPGREVVRVVSPDNLKRLGGGVLENDGPRDEG